jgi:hypothetical protein
MKLITSVKKAPSVFFEKSGIRTKNKFIHSPVIALVNKDGKVTVKIIDTPEALISMPKRTKIVAQWIGKNRSDYFSFSVGKLREYIENNPKKAGMAI